MGLIMVIKKAPTYGRGFFLLITGYDSLRMAYQPAAIGEPDEGRGRGQSHYRHS